MTRKSTSKFKAVNAQNSSKFLKNDLPPIEETFENIKQVMINTADAAIIVAQRIDNLLNIRRACHEFFGSEFNDKHVYGVRVDYFKEKQELTIEAYKQIAEVVREFELEEFLKEDMKDYFEDLMPKCENIGTEEGLFNAFLISGIVKPWGEKMNQLHYQMLDEKKQREDINGELGK